MGEPGHIYVMVNPSIEGLVKIGKTTREPESRAKELSQATGVATPFYVAFSIAVADCHSAEEYVHAVLEYNGFKRSPNREFFQMPLRKAVEVLTLVEKELAEKGDETATLGTARESNGHESASDSTTNVHPAWELMERARAIYFGTQDEIQDKDEALRLLRKARSLGFSGAFTSLAWHYTQEAGASVAAGDARRTKKLMEQAFEILKEGGRSGHHRCYPMMASLFETGWGSSIFEPDPANATKCWRKYFHSETFLKNNDCGTASEPALSQVCLGATRTTYAYQYLYGVWKGRLHLDEEIRRALISIREELMQALSERIERLESRMAKKPPIIIAPPKRGILSRFFIKPNVPINVRDEDSEELEHERRFSAFVGAIL